MGRLKFYYYIKENGKKHRKSTGLPEITHKIEEIKTWVLKREGIGTWVFILGGFGEVA